MVNVILKPAASGVIQNYGDIISKNTHKLSQKMESIFNVKTYLLLVVIVIVSIVVLVSTTTQWDGSCQNVEG
jgi:hypothetical protein